MTDRPELKEQDLLSRLELHSGYDSDDGVDCSLKLGFSDIHGKQPRVMTASQMLQNNGVMNGKYECYYHNSYGAQMNLAGWRDGFFYQGGPSSFVDRAVTTCALNNSYAKYQPMAMNNNAPLQSFHGYSRQCTVCGTTSTPLWRNGPRGAKTLCNACGIRFRKEERRANGNPGTNGSEMNGP